MKKIHIPLAALAAGLVLGAGTCNENAGGKAALAGAVQGKWILERLDGGPVHMPEGREMPFLSIDSLGENVSGHAGCNRIFGPVKLSGDSISFPGMAATRMYCVETQQVEDAFLGALNHARTYTLKDDRLTLLGGKELAVLRKEK